jgi:hypothetical protein
MVFYFFFTFCIVEEIPLISGGFYDNIYNKKFLLF